MFDTEALCLNASSGLLGGKLMVVFGWPTCSGNITRLELSLHCRYPVRRRVQLVRQRSMHCCFRSVKYFGLFVLVAEHSLTFLPWLSMYFLSSHVHSFGFCFKVSGGDCCFNVIEGLKKIPLGLGYL